MKWIKLASAYYLDPAVVALDDAAEVMFTRALAYCGQAESDGFIPDAVVSMLSRRQRGAAKVAAKLVLAGLIEPVSGGYRVVKWEIWQTTNDEMGAKREAGRQRVAKHRQGNRKPSISKNTEPPSNGNGVTPPVTPDPGNGVTPDPCNAFVTPLEVEVEVEVETPTPNGVGTHTTTALATTNDAPNAQALVGEWIDHCTSRPPQAVIGQVSKQLRAMLGEGIPYEHVRRGLATWASKGLHPSTLPSVVNEVMNARPATTQAKPSTTDQRVQATLALAAKYPQ